MKRTKVMKLVRKGLAMIVYASSVGFCNRRQVELLFGPLNGKRVFLDDDSGRLDEL